MDGSGDGLLAGARARLEAARAGLQRDWESGVVPISMMGLQAQTVVGSMVNLMQSVYLVQLGARAAIISNYLVWALPINLMASCGTVALLVGVSIRHSYALFVVGCCTSLLASVALTCPPSLHSDPELQGVFLSHYFGSLFVVANIGAKFRDYPNGLARVYLLRGTEVRASEKAYNTIFDVMVGNGLNGALMLTMLAKPVQWVRIALVILQVASTIVSLRGAFILRQLRELLETSGCGGGEPPTPKVIGARDASPEVEDYALETVLEFEALAKGPAPAKASLRGSEVLWGAVKLTLNPQVWQLMAIEWLVGFIYTLNSQDCTAQCAASMKPDCAAACHADAHASVTRGTVTLVKVLYAGVTPGAYLAACMMMRLYSGLPVHKHQELRREPD